MKKFLSALIVVLTFVLMSVQVASAADVPDFRSVKPSAIKLAWDTDPDEDYKIEPREWAYECNNIGATENFVKHYVNALVQTGYFKLIGHYRHTESNGTFERYYLDYTGSKRIQKMSHVGSPCDIDVQYTVGDKLVFISVAAGLTYGKEDTSPTPVRNNSVQTKPAQNPPAVKNTGADVPDLEQFGGIVYSSHKQNGDKSVTYFFHAHNLSETASDALTAKYIQLLTSSYNFVQTGYEDKKFEHKRVQAVRKSEKWTFRYTGSKRVWDLSDGNHIHMRRIRNRQTGETTFEIRVAYGLTFAGNYGAATQVGNGQTTCSACSGSGKCSICSGRGYYGVGNDYNQPCGACLTSGKCSDCDGKGYR